MKITGYADSRFVGYDIASPFIRAELVSLSKTVPAGPALPYDARGASNSRILYYVLNPEMDLQKNVEFYINMSRINSFLRSEKGLPYNENWRNNEVNWKGIITEK